MMTFLFWNAGGNDIAPAIVRVAHRHGVDVLMLAECRARPADVLLGLNRLGRPEYHLAGGQCARISVFTRFPGWFMQPVDESDHVTVRRLSLPGTDEALVAIAHLRSKLYSEPEDQGAVCRALAEQVRRAERQAGHERTLLVGDLNVNPFEAGACAADALHGVMTREIAARRSRSCLREERLFFYNPMWGRLGDSTAGPPGTYYRDAGAIVTYFWNTFDQVLLRPALLDRFSDEDLVVLTETDGDGGESLLSQGGRPAVAVSDHLPILFRLDL